MCNGSYHQIWIRSDRDKTTESLILLFRGSSSTFSFSNHTSRMSWIDPTVPLTTIFTPPYWCNKRLLTSSTPLSPSDSYALQTFGPVTTGSNADCYVHSQRYDVLYSPGVSPVGWTVNATFGQNEPITTSYCCPMYVYYRLRK